MGVSTIPCVGVRGAALFQPRDTVVSRLRSKPAMKHLSIVCLGVVLAVVAVGAQKQKYGVTVTADRKTDFSAFKSYAWDTAGYPALDKNVHQQIVDAVDRELKGLGLQKRASGPGRPRSSLRGTAPDRH